MAQHPASRSKLARDVGDQAVTVTLAGTELAAGDLDGYTVRRGRGNVDEQPTAATCTLNVHAAALPELPNVGDDLVVELGPDALTWLGIAEGDPGSPALTPTVAAVGAALAGGNGTTAAIPVPAGVVAGQLVLVQLYVETDAAITAPAGFAQAALAENNTTSLSHRVYVFWKRATSSDSGTYSFSWTGSTWREGHALRIDGAPASGDPFDGTPTTTVRTGGAASPDPLTATTTEDDGLLVYVSASFQSSSSWTPPAGFTEHVDNSALASSSKTLATAGASGNVAGSSSTTSALSAVLLAVKATPAVAGSAGADVAIPRFAGTVTDARIVPGRFTDTGKDVVQVIAASPLAKLGRTFIGDTPWPQDLDADRATRILREAAAETVDGIIFAHFGPPPNMGTAGSWLFSSTGSTAFTRTTVGDTADTFGGAVTGYKEPLAAGPHTFFIGHLVDVIPGTVIKATVSSKVILGGSLASVDLVVADQTTTYRGATSTSFGVFTDTDKESTSYLVPAGVTQITVGIQAVAVDPGAVTDSNFALALTELSVTSFEIAPGALDSEAFTKPDLRVDSTVGNGFVYARPASSDEPYDRNGATSDPVTQYQLSDVDCGYPQAAPRTYFFGRNVAVTEGVTYRLQVGADLQSFESIGGVSLWVDDQETVITGPIDYGSGGLGSFRLGQNVAGDPGASANLYTAAATGTVLVGFEISDRMNGNTFVANWTWVDAFSWTALDVQGPYLEAIGGTVQVVPRDVDRQNALQLLTDLALDARGLVLDTRAGLVGYADADDRFGAPVAITLDDSECIVGSEWATGLGGVVNDAVIRYGASEPQLETRRTDDASVKAHGTIAISRSTQLARQVDAELVADRIVTLMAQPHYRMPTLIVDVLRTLTSSAQRLALLRLDQSSLIALTDFPASGPLATGQLWLEGYTERLSAQGWRFELQVSDFLAGGPNTLEEA